MKRRVVLLLLAAAPLAALRAALPPVPVPAENPITEPKRVLGKILFWDEQLSSNDTVACGTCHRPAAGGADPRAGRNPGTDAGTIDDVQGSPGIALLNADNQPVKHPVFDLGPQITRRRAPSNFGALWADEVFWDGRAGSVFNDPITGKVAIARGGALENQALASLSDPAEMARPARPWQELTRKLEHVTPLALAGRLPPDVEAALGNEASYPQLFAQAFGDAAITPLRIAFAIATYERTLVADQAPWDRYEAGDASALGESARYGWQALQDFRCVNCHKPPLFTNNDFANIGLRRSDFDLGREAITHDTEDRGEMKIPSLRNVGLRRHLMHTGEFGGLASAVGFYIQGPAFPERDEIPGAGAYSFNMDSFAERDISTFLAEGLTDPRVAAEQYPFDRPLLGSERTPTPAPK
jgi:cytochrome c peroxidase